MNFQFNGFQFNDMSAFLAMGGHGFYVWSAYGVSLLLLSYLVIRPLLRRAEVLKTVRRVHDQSQRKNQSGRHDAPDT